MRCKTQASNI